MARIFFPGAPIQLVAQGQGAASAAATAATQDAAR
jgi:hypothetical protein